MARAGVSGDGDNGQLGGFAGGDQPGVEGLAARIVPDDVRAEVTDRIVDVTQFTPGRLAA